METLLSQIRADAVNRYIPVIRPKGAEFLKDLIFARKPKKILEIGTGIGYSGILMLASGGARLVTIDSDEERLEIARENFKRAEFQSRVEVILDDAKTALPLFGRMFDFIFVDAAKAQYGEFLRLAEPLLEPGGAMLFDNVSYHGLVAREDAVAHHERTIVVKLRKFLEEVEKSKTLTSTYYKDISDGMLLLEKQEG